MVDDQRQGELARLVEWLLHECFQRLRKHAHEFFDLEFRWNDQSRAVLLHVADRAGVDAIRYIGALSRNSELPHEFFQVGGQFVRSIQDISAKLRSLAVSTEVGDSPRIRFPGEKADIEQKFVELDNLSSELKEIYMQTRSSVGQ